MSQDTVDYLWHKHILLVNCQLFEEEVVSELAILSDNIDPTREYELTCNIGVPMSVKVKPSQDMVKPTPVVYKYNFKIDRI